MVSGAAENARPTRLRGRREGRSASGRMQCLGLRDASVGGLIVATGSNSVSHERSQDSSLQRPHPGLFLRLGVVPAADVQGAVDRKQQQLLDGCPTDVTGLATPAVGGLGDGPFR